MYVRKAILGDLLKPLTELNEKIYNLMVNKICVFNMYWSETKV